MNFYGAATIGVKGQIVIPAEAREKLGLKEKDKLVVFGAPHDSGIVLVKADSLDTIIDEFVGNMESVKKLAAKHDESKN